MAESDDRDCSKGEVAQIEGDDSQMLKRVLLLNGSQGSTRSIRKADVKIHTRSNHFQSWRFA